MTVRRVTILIPTFNPNVSYLSQALKSLEAQHYRDFSVLIVDESTNKCVEDIKNLPWNFEINLIRPLEKVGLSKSIALGVSIINSEFIARFDADDICMPNRLLKQVEFLSKNTDIHVVGSYAYKINTNSAYTGLRCYPINHDQIISKMHILCTICHPSVMIRKSFFRTYGNYSGDYDNEDYELWLRSSSLGARFYNIPIPLIKYRIPEAGRNSRSRYWKENLFLKVKYFDRQYFFNSVAGVLLMSIAVFFPESVFKHIYKIFNKLR